MEVQNFATASKADKALVQLLHEISFAYPNWGTTLLPCKLEPLMDNNASGDNEAYLQIARCCRAKGSCHASHQS